MGQKVTGSSSRPSSHPAHPGSDNYARAARLIQAILPSKPSRFRQLRQSSFIPYSLPSPLPPWPFGVSPPVPRRPVRRPLFWLFAPNTIYRKNQVPGENRKIKVLLAFLISYSPPPNSLSIHTYTQQPWNHSPISPTLQTILSQKTFLP